MTASFRTAHRGVAVKKLSLHEIYSFGRAMPALSWVKQETKVFDYMAYVLAAQNALRVMLADDSPLLETARRAARKLLNALFVSVPDDPKKWSTAIKDDTTFGWHASTITTALAELESVLSNDMPGIAAYLVRKKGIFDTEALIEHPEKQLNAETCALLPEQAANDLQASGKCLAYELSTASAFHLWRAVETVADRYYEHLAGKTFKQARIQRTWNSYIVAMRGAQADEAITSFLDFIRVKYRNPQTHPSQNVSSEQAKSLFSVATSVIDQMLAQIKETEAAPKVSEPPNEVKAQPTIQEVADALMPEDALPQE